MSTRHDIIAAMPATITRMVMATGYSRTLIKRTINALRDTGESHISGWHQDLRQIAPIHCLGAGVDVPKIPPKSATQMSREYRSRVGNPEHARTAGIIPAALMAQRRVFPLAGVWA